MNKVTSIQEALDARKNGYRLLLKIRERQVILPYQNVAEMQVKHIQKFIDEKRLLKERMDKCVQCGELYDRKQLMRSLGEESAVVYGGYCSARCYTEKVIK